MKRRINERRIWSLLWGFVAKGLAIYCQKLCSLLPKAWQFTAEGSALNYINMSKMKIKV